MPNLLLISVSEWDTRVAFLEDGRLAEFYVEGRAQNGPVGNIYKGRVVKLLPGMAAAFVDVGAGAARLSLCRRRHAQEDEFFQIWLKDEIEENPSCRRLPAPTISDLLHEGQEVLVQVLRGPAANKGARLTTHISLAGHYLVYMPTLSQWGFPGASLTNPSASDSRPSWKNGPARSRGPHRPHRQPGPESLEKMTRERDVLMGDLAAPPAQKRRRPPAPPSSTRNWRPPGGWCGSSTPPKWTGSWWTTPPASSASPTIWNPSAPWNKFRVELYTEPEPIFSHFGLEIDWQKLLAPRVWLKSGGYLLIEATEALTAIDVNTGKFVGRSHLEETILKTNLEAAREIARQLRLRNIGGLIVIDFIDQEKAANRDLVYQTLVEALARDRAKTTALPISSLGLVEMTRQRVRDSLAQTIMETCGACGGKGLAVTPQNPGQRPAAPAGRRGPGIPRLPPASCRRTPRSPRFCRRTGPASWTAWPKNTRSR